jgi:Mg2+-importing ATPase
MEHPELAGSEAFNKIDEIPFDFERRRLSIVVEKAGERTLIVKGAPEGIMPLAMAYASPGAGDVAMTTAVAAKCNETFQTLSARGLRVLAVATRKVPNKPDYRASDETQLVLLGFVAFADPPLPDAKEAIALLKGDGVQVKILTGDNELVARHVCSEVGLDVENIVLGEDVESANDSALSAMAEKASVFARLSPAQKNRVILALKHRSHVVGYLGDGINDAPSLHAADVGISVATAVDVARDAADIILLEDSLQVLHKGIREGRKAFGNVTKYVVMGTSSNFGNMFSMAAASMFLSFLPMLPTQILVNNLLYDFAQVTIPSDNVDPEVLIRPQRWQVRTLRDFMLVIGPISSLFDFLTFYVLLRLFHANEVFFHTGWFVESLATQTLVLFVIRTHGNPLKSRPSLPLTLTTLGITLLGVIVPYTPLAGLLGFVPLPLGYLLFVALATAAYLGLVEAGKQWLLGRSRPKP